MTVKKSGLKAKPKKVDQEAVMRSRGYIPAIEVSDKMGIDPQTVYRWFDEEKVASLQVANRRYANVASLVKHITPEVAKIFGIIVEATKPAEKAAEQ